MGEADSSSNGGTNSRKGRGTRPHGDMTLPDVPTTTPPAASARRKSAVRPRAAAAPRAAGPAVAVEIDYWTDPLCCWSWALEPQWRRLRYEFDGVIAWRYRMGGMIPDWSSYSDPMNSISRPLQMGPLWFQARHLSGMPIDDKLWVEDPPSSSYLPCVAVKAAERQSPRAAEVYLRRLREAVMCRRRNVARREVLLSIADELAADRPAAFDAAAFARDLDAPRAVELFREDLKHAGYRSIGRFPTLTLRRPGAGNGIIVVGYRPYPALLQALAQVAPELTPVNPVTCPRAYAAYWGDLLPRELTEITSGHVDAGPLGNGGPPEPRGSGGASPSGAR